MGDWATLSLVCSQNRGTHGTEKATTLQGQADAIAKIPGSEKIDMSFWRTAAPNELCFKLSTRIEDLATGAVDHPAPQSPATQTTEALWFSWSEIKVMFFQHFTEYYQSKFAEMEEDAQRKGTILSIVRVNTWIVIVIQLFTEKEI